jgi:hypothetical protein
LFLNVCGLKSKLLYHDFYDLINKLDICLFVETKTDDLDVLNVPNGYLYYCKHRSAFDKKKNQVVLLFCMKKNISLQRFSQDSSPINNYGYKLLDFCKKNEHLYWK